MKLREALLDWQWQLYPDNHLRRVTLLVHIITVPLFWCGLSSLLTAPLMQGAASRALAGVGLMVLAVFAQGRTHRLEPTPPQPFLGPLDVVSRIVAEQLITFPRFVWSGAFARAWRATATTSS